MADKYGDHASSPKSKVPSSSRLSSSSRATSASMAKGSTKSSQSATSSQPPPAYQTRAAQPESMPTLQRDRPKEHFEIREGSKVKYPTEKVPATKYLPRNYKFTFAILPAILWMNIDQISISTPRSQYRQTICHPQPKKQNPDSIPLSSSPGQNSLSHRSSART